MKKNIIWSNEYEHLLSEYNSMDWEYVFENENEHSEDEKWDYVCELNDMYIDDERVNLDIDLPEDIVVIADLGTWRGRFDGYKIIDGNISDCLYDECDYVEWYCDRYNFRCNASHHDGNNHYLYRMWRNGITETQKQNFLNAILNKTLTSKMITRYTKSLRPYIAKVYGW